MRAILSHLEELSALSRSAYYGMFNVCLFATATLGTVQFYAHRLDESIHGQLITQGST